MLDDPLAQCEVFLVSGYDPALFVRGLCAQGEDVGGGFFATGAFAGLAVAVAFIRFIIQGAVDNWGGVSIDGFSVDLTIAFRCRGGIRGHGDAVAQGL